MGKPAAQPDNKSCRNTRGTVSRALITLTVPGKEKGETREVVSLKQVTTTLQPAQSPWHPAELPCSVSPNVSGTLAGSGRSWHTPLRASVLWSGADQAVPT